MTNLSTGRINPYPDALKLSLMGSHVLGRPQTVVNREAQHSKIWGSDDLGRNMMVMLVSLNKFLRTIKSILSNYKTTTAPTRLWRLVATNWWAWNGDWSRSQLVATNLPGLGAVTILLLVTIPIPGWPVVCPSNGATTHLLGWHGLSRWAWNSEEECEVLIFKVLRRSVI